MPVTKLALKYPLPAGPYLTHDPNVTGVPEIEHVASEGEMAPKTTTCVDAGPLGGTIVMFNERVTLKRVWAESPIGLPLTVTTYVAGATFLTTKVAATMWVTLLMLQAPLFTGVPDTEQVVSLEANDELFVMVTEVPGGPEGGLGVLRAGCTTWNVA